MASLATSGTASGVASAAVLAVGKGVYALRVTVDGAGRAFAVAVVTALAVAALG
jgi:hypothetical protein